MHTLPKLLLVLLSTAIIISACASVTITKCHPPANDSLSHDADVSIKPNTPLPPNTSDGLVETSPDTSVDNIPDTSTPPSPEPTPDTIVTPTPTPSPDPAPTPEPTRTTFYYNSLYEAVSAINKGEYSSTLNNAAVSVNTEHKVPQITVSGICTDYKDIVIKQNVHLSLNNTICLSGDAEITIEPNVIVTIDGKNGGIEKTSDTNHSVYLIHNKGTLSLNCGYYYLATMSDDASVVYSDGPILRVENATLVASSTQGRVYAIQTKDCLELSVASSKLSSESNKGRAITIYSTESSDTKLSNVNIVDCQIIAKSQSHGAQGIFIRDVKSILLIDNHVTATSHQSSYLGGEVCGVHITNYQDAIINKGTYIAYQTTSGAAEASAIESLGNLVVNNASFYGYSSSISGEAYLNDCIFSGCHSGLETHGSKVVIAGGQYESPWHGGIYACSNETYICDAVLRMTPYSKSLCYQNTKYRPHEADGTMYEGTYYSCMYIGSPYCETKAYLDNCKFEGLEHLTTGNAISVSSNYGYLNSACYISNVLFDAYIRVDGLSQTNQIASLYVGENVQYIGIHGKGNVDTATYHNQSFRYSNETRS